MSIILNRLFIRLTTKKIEITLLQIRKLLYTEMLRNLIAIGLPDYVLTSFKCKI